MVICIIILNLLYYIICYIKCVLYLIDYDIYDYNKCIIEYSSILNVFSIL